MTTMARMSAILVAAAGLAFATTPAGSDGVEGPRGQRINVVSPGVIAEAMAAYAPFFRGFEPVPAARAALAYAKSVEGAQTGKVFRVV